MVWRGTWRMLHRTWKTGGGSSVLRRRRRYSSMSGYSLDVDLSVLHAPFGSAFGEAVPLEALSRSEGELLDGEQDWRWVVAHRGRW